MYLLGEQPAYADQLINRLQSIPTQLLDGLQPTAATLRLERVDDLAQVEKDRAVILAGKALMRGAAPRCAR